MTIRFAAAVPGNAHPLLRGLAGGRITRPANDNEAGDPSDAMVFEALRHFAQHGLAAARHARARAQACFFAGDRAGYDWWLEVCRQLDKRLARECERELACEQGSHPA